MYSTTWTFKCHIRSSYIMRCIYRFGMYAAHAPYIRPPHAIESHWPPRVRGMYAVHTPLAPCILNGQVLIRSGIAIHTPYAPHVRHPYAIDTQLIRNTCEIVAPEMFHQTVSAILPRICSFFRTPYERRGIAGQWNTGITFHGNSCTGKTVWLHWKSAQFGICHESTTLFQWLCILQIFSWRILAPILKMNMTIFSDCGIKRLNLANDKCFRDRCILSRQLFYF